MSLINQNKRDTNSEEKKTANGLARSQTSSNRKRLFEKDRRKDRPHWIEEYQTEIQGNREGIAGLSAAANQKHVSFKQSPTKGSENYVQRT